MAYTAPCWPGDEIHPWYVPMLGSAASWCHYCDTCPCNPSTIGQTLGLSDICWRDSNPDPARSSATFSDHPASVRSLDYHLHPPLLESGGLRAWTNPKALPSLQQLPQSPVSLYSPLSSDLSSICPIVRPQSCTCYWLSPCTCPAHTQA